MKTSPLFIASMVFAASAGMIFAQDVLAVASAAKVDLDASIGSEKSENQKWNFKVGAGYNVSRGNNESEAYSGNFEAARSYKSADIRATLDGAYAEQTTEETVDGVSVSKDDCTESNVKGKLELKYLFNDNFIYSDFSALNDDVAGVDYRFVESLGVGRYIVRSDELSISGQLGLAYVQEKLTETDNYLGVRAAERVDWKPVFAEGVSFYEAVEGIMDIDETDKYLINGEAGIDIPVFANLSVTFKVVYAYNSLPADDKEKADTQCVTQLTYRF